jgi:hypothetical protein
MHPSFLAYLEKTQPFRDLYYKPDMYKLGGAIPMFHRFLSVLVVGLSSLAWTEFLEQESIGNGT